jgi:hypothetical protein
LVAQRATEIERVAESQARHRKEKRDLAMAIVLAVASLALTLFLKITLAAIALFLGLVVFAGYVGNLDRVVGMKALKLRSIQALIIILGAVIETAALYPFWKEEQALALEGDLVGAGPAIRDGQSHGFPPLQIGKTTIWMAPDGTPDIMPFFKDSGVRIEWGYKGPLLTTPVRDRNGNLLAEIVRNHWRVYPQYCADKNYNKEALEIKDSAGHIVLQAKILPTRIELQGEWWNTEGKGIRLAAPELGAPASSGAEISYLGKQQQHLESSIRPIFEYPGKDHWQELVAAR